MRFGSFQREAERRMDSILDTADDDRDSGREGMVCVCADLSYILEITLLSPPVYQGKKLKFKE